MTSSDSSDTAIYLEFGKVFVKNILWVVAIVAGISIVIGGLAGSLWVIGRIANQITIAVGYGDNTVFQLATSVLLLAVIVLILRIAHLSWLEVNDERSV